MSGDVISLLQRVPTTLTWLDHDNLTAMESESLKSLVAAGLIDRFGVVEQWPERPAGRSFPVSHQRHREQWRLNPSDGADAMMVIAAGFHQNVREFVERKIAGLASGDRWIFSAERTSTGLPNSKADAAAKNAAAFNAYMNALPDTPPAETPEKGADRPTSASHSPDFTSVDWFNTTYVFTPTQARIVEVLWKAWEGRAAALGLAYILEKSEVPGDRIDTVFRVRGNGKHSAWDTMIKRGGKGVYQLVPPEQK